MNKDVPLTALSKKEWDIIVDTDMNPSDVTAYFFNHMQIRHFSELLKNYSKELLINRLCEYDNEAKRDSIRRKVSNWYSDQNQPTDREELIKICFALELDEMNAQRFMSFSFDSGFHLRNPREVTFLFCIRTRKSYPEALSLIDRLGIPEYNSELTAILTDHEDIIIKEIKANLTKVIADAFANIDSADAFCKFYEDNYANFGHLHNTSYVYFMHFFNELIRPHSPVHTQKDDDYSIEKAVDTYLRMDLPLDKKTTKYSVVQKAIRSFWPNVTIIKNIRNRREDVNRKVLLLLYVVTEGIGGTDFNDDFFPEELTPAEMLEEHAWKINLMLHDCGMGMLDPRNPFDWLILYSLKTNDDDKGMSERLQEVLNILFE